MFGNVSWGREASPPRTSPLGQLAPRGAEGSSLPPRRTRSTPAATRGASQGAVTVVRCAGCREARAQGWGEAKVAGEREVGRAPTQTPSSPSSAHAWAAPEPPGNKCCPPTRPRAGQRSGDSERESSEALPARGCAEPDRWGSWAGNSGPAPLRPSGRAPPSAPEPRSESDSCARGNWVFPNRAQHPRRKSSRSGRGRRADTHFLHSSARARARRRETRVPTARSGTLLRSQTSFLLFGTKFPFLKKERKKKEKEKRKKKSPTQFSLSSKNKSAAQATIFGRRRGLGGWRGAAPQRRQQRPTARRSREAGARRGGLSASSASICKPRDAEEGEKTVTERGAKPKSPQARTNAPRSPEGATAQASAAGERDAVGETGPKSRARARARPARGRYAEWK